MTTDTMRVDIGCCRAAQGFIAVSHALALGAAVYVAREQALVWLALPLILFSAWRTLCLHGLRCSPDALIALEWRGDGRWLLFRRDGVVLEPDGLAERFLHPYVLVLSFNGFWMRHPSLVLTRSAIGETLMRRLYVRLKVQGLPTRTSAPHS